MALHIYTQGRFNNYTACSLYRIMVMATSVMSVMKMGNIVPRVGLKPTYLAFWAPHSSLMSPLSPHPPVYAAPCLRGLCRLLQYCLTCWFQKQANLPYIIANFNPSNKKLS